jgi:DeoR family transcriptional regulator, fructose operon transcriptional repressor
VGDDTLFVEERKQKILEFIEDRRKATVTELCERFKVSSATIRNDLRDLQAGNLLIRTHGGAIVKSKTGLETDMNARKVQNLAAKRRIAEAAIRLVEDGDTIILDSGTTTLELARLLSQKRDITVVTNDLTIALCLEEIESVRVVLMGGSLRRRFHCTVTHGATQNGMLSGLAVDKAFMGVNSFSTEKGASTPDIAHGETKKLMMSIAQKIILLFDATKMERNSFVLFAPLDRVDTIVTDTIGEGDRKRLEESGIEVISAE